MIVKYGIKNFVKDIGFNIFIIALVALTFAACIFASSSVYQKLKYYNVFSDILEGDGCYGVTSRQNSEYGHFFLTFEFEDVKTLSPVFDNLSDAYACYNVLDSSEYRLTPNGDYSYAYRDDMIYKYEPMMQQGKWLSQVKKEDGVIHAVISPNDLGIGVGDVITQGFSTAEGTVVKEVEIVGVFREGAKFFGIHPERALQEDDFNATHRIDELFHNYYQKLYEAPMLVYDLDELQQIGSIETIYSGIFMSYKDGLSDEQKEQTYSQIVDTTKNIVPFSDIRSATLAEVRKQLIILVPVVLGLLLLTMISVLSLTAISTHKQLKNYGVLYLCGGRWRQCALINSVTVFIDVVFSAMLAYIAMTALSLSGKLQTTIVRFTKAEFLICLSVAVFVMLVSLIMPFAIIGKTQPKDILKEEE